VHALSLCAVSHYSTVSYSNINIPTAIQGGIESIQSTNDRLSCMSWLWFSFDAMARLIRQGIARAEAVTDRPSGGQNAFLTCRAHVSRRVDFGQGNQDGRPLG